MFIIDICTSRRGMNGKGDYLANLFSIVSTRKMFSGKRMRAAGCIVSSSVIELSKYEMGATWLHDRDQLVRYYEIARHIAILIGTSLARAESRSVPDKSRSISFVPGTHTRMETLSIRRVESSFCNLDRRHGARTLFRSYTGRQTSGKIIQRRRVFKSFLKRSPYSIKVEVIYVELEKNPKRVVTFIYCSSSEIVNDIMNKYLAAINFEI